MQVKEYYNKDNKFSLEIKNQKNKLTRVFLFD
jgi:hypothetical protein